LKLGVLGGTFDPIHYGHLYIAEAARKTIGLDEIIFIPTGIPWLKERINITEAKHRLEMVRIATKSNKFFTVSSMEVDRPGNTYTRDTLIQLKDKLPKDTQIFFIIGGDSYNSFYKWKEPKVILNLVNLVVIKRPGHIWEQVNGIDNIIFIEGPIIDISGTEIRTRVSEISSLKGMIPKDVENYIYQHKLYSSKDHYG